MAHAVIMPRQGQSVETCIIGRWHKAVGDSVAVGDLLFSYETDKASFEERAEVAGQLLAIFFEEGDDVPVLANVCVIGEEGEDASAFAPTEGAAAPAPAVEAAPAAPATAVPEAPAATTAADGELPTRVSPRARARAARGGLSLEGLVGSGPQGRVIERDVVALAASGVAPAAPLAEAEATAEAAPPAAAPAVASVDALDKLPPVTRFEGHSQIRRVIARTMRQSLSELAQLTIDSSCDATALLALRQRLKDGAAAGLTAEQGFELCGRVPTLNDLLLYAVSRVLPRHPRLNAHYSDEGMTYFDSVQLGIAVDTERGLMVPTLPHAERRSLAEISVGARALIDACLGGAIDPDKLTGASFTVTNLGTLGVERFTPVINPPQTAILGVCAITTRLRETAEGTASYPALGLSLTFDHRAVDGAPAARFLQDLVRLLEHIDLALLKG